MVKQEIMNVIRKRLNSVKNRRDIKLKEKLKEKYKADVKKQNDFRKKSIKLSEKIRKLEDERSKQVSGHNVFRLDLKARSKNSFYFNYANDKTPAYNLSYTGVKSFNVNEEFDKIEEELILSEDESGTLREILGRIASM